MRAARTLANDGTPNVDALEEYAQAMEVLRVGVADRRLSCGWIEPTEDDVRNARDLVQLIREGVPNEALVDPARRAACVVTDPWELERFQSALFCLDDEASRIQHLGRVQEVFDLTIALFERGCRVAGCVPTPMDIANLRRLREVAATDGAEALAERQRLVQELNARLPRTGGVEREMAAEILYLNR